MTSTKFCVAVVCFNVTNSQLYVLPKSSAAISLFSNFVSSFFLLPIRHISPHPSIFMSLRAMITSKFARLESQY